MLFLPCIVQIRVLVGDHHQKLPSSVCGFFLSHFCFLELSLYLLQGKRVGKRKHKDNVVSCCNNVFLIRLFQWKFENNSFNEFSALFFWIRQLCLPFISSVLTKRKTQANVRYWALSGFLFHVPCQLQEILASPSASQY